MAKIIIQKNTGEEVKVIQVGASFRDTSHVLLGTASVIQDILNALHTALDFENPDKKPSDPK